MLGSLHLVLVWLGAVSEHLAGYQICTQGSPSLNDDMGIKNDVSFLGFPMLLFTPTKKETNMSAQQQ